MHLISDIKKAEQLRALSVIDTSSEELHQYVLERHVDIFQQASRHFHCYILLRRTNPNSLKYIGKQGFIPKPVDCKPKTAKNNVQLLKNKTQISKCAGLVVKPQEVGMGAFEGAYQLSSAVNLWRNYFEPLPANFSVEEDPNSGFYGCVKKQDSEHAPASYIHGDYDLYAIVDAFNPKQRYVKQGRFAGNEHSYGKLWQKVSTYLNQNFGVHMIQHGSQEHFCYHTDETIDMFTPFEDRDLWRVKVSGSQALSQLYEELFEGRTTKAQKMIYL